MDAPGLRAAYETHTKEYLESAYRAENNPPPATSLAANLYTVRLPSPEAAWMKATAVARVQACEVTRAVILALRPNYPNLHVADTMPEMTAHAMQQMRAAVVDSDPTHVRARMQWRMDAAARFAGAAIGSQYDIGRSLYESRDGGVGMADPYRHRVAPDARDELDAIWSAHILIGAKSLLALGNDDDDGGGGGGTDTGDTAVRFIHLAYQFADALRAYLTRAAQYLLRDTSQPSSPVAPATGEDQMPSLVHAENAAAAAHTFTTAQEVRAKAHAGTSADTLLADADGLLPPHMSHEDTIRLAGQLFAGGVMPDGTARPTLTGGIRRARCVRVLLDAVALLGRERLGWSSPSCVIALARAILTLPLMEGVVGRRGGKGKQEAARERGDKEDEDGGAAAEVAKRVSIGVGISMTMRLFGYASREPRLSDQEAARAPVGSHPGISVLPDEVVGGSEDGSTAAASNAANDAAKKVAARPYLVGTPMPEKTLEEISAYRGRGSAVPVDKDTIDWMHAGQDTLWPPPLSLSNDGSEADQRGPEGRGPMDDEDSDDNPSYYHTARPGEIPGFLPRTTGRGQGLPTFAGWLVPLVCGPAPDVAAWYRAIGVWPPLADRGSPLTARSVIADVEPAEIVPGFAPPETLECTLLRTQGGRPAASGGGVAQRVLLRARVVDVVADHAAAARDPNTTDPTLTLWGLMAADAATIQAAIGSMTAPSPTLAGVVAASSPHADSATIAQADAVLRYLAPGGQERAISCAAALSLASYALNGGDGDGTNTDVPPFVIAAIDTELGDADAAGRQAGIESEISRNVLAELDTMFVLEAMDREAALLAREL